MLYTTQTLLFPDCALCGQPQEDRDADGLHYSIDTRVVEIGSGPRVLQVQLLYSEAGQSNVSPTPGWSSTASSLEVHPGGKEIKLDVRTAPVNMHPFLYQADVNRIPTAVDSDRAIGRSCDIPQ